ncbi:hypothetical protein P5G62_002370 [Neobacillus sp. 179-C4.2 HS]|uniref:Uncharacterized protein n=1 Tax=Neobacillus driksii TaxID=3035913 RepID=A0ABV4YPF2_9BACI|nr:hypothetical protein [Neobacillus sp. 179.-C4.2 HS]MDP5193286.1 hypothetical protein [Neobacillus sp. 179.-C4.2 HS]
MIKKITVFLLGLLLLIPINGMAAAESAISVDMHYLVVSPAEDGSTNMMNMVNYTNTTAEEYKGDGTGEAVLNVTIPTGAIGFTFLDNKMAQKQVETGFITTDPIPANQTVVLPYSYRIAKGEEISLSFDYPVQMMQILVPEGMGSIVFKNVTATNQGLFKMDDQNYQGYSVEGIQAKQVLTMIYDQDKQPAASDAQGSTEQGESKSSGNVTKTAPAFHNPGHLRMWSQSPLRSWDPHVFLIVMGAIIIAAISYYSYFRMRARAEEKRLGADKEESAFKNLMAKQKAIMDKILELEENFGDGNMSEEDYQAKLAAYKQHLVQVKMNLRHFVE